MSSLSKIPPNSFGREKKDLPGGFSQNGKRREKNLVNVYSTERSELVVPALSTILWLEMAEEFGTRAVC